MNHRNGFIKRLHRRLIGPRLPEPIAFPLPYQAMLAISSDVEYTSWQSQLGLIELAGRHGLEMAFSYWCFGDPELTWRLLEDDNTPSSQANAAFSLARAGILDTLHSFGGVTDGRGAAFDRSRIAPALQRLRDAGVGTRVYSNHGTIHDVQNVGGDWASYQKGDVPGHPSYHLDLTTGFGIRFFWTDIDSDSERSFFGIGPKAGKPLFSPQAARDGQRILRFRRFRGPFTRAPHAGTFAAQLDMVLSHPVEGYSVVYQHLGITRDGDGPARQVVPPYFDPKGMAAFERLASLQRDGVLLVTTTERLLVYALLMQARPWAIEHHEDIFQVTFARRFEHCGVSFDLRKADLQGWTLPLNEATRVVARFDGEEWELPIAEVGGRRYATIPWTRIAMLDELEKAKSLARA